MPVDAIVIAPDPFVIVTPEPAVNVVRVNPVPFPMSKAPFAGVDVKPVPPLATATVPVTLVALPDKAPTNVVDVTEVRPAIVVAEPPRLIAVEPTVMLEFVRAPLGMLVRLAPEPLNTVAAKVPVEGVYLYFVELVYSVVTTPLVAVENSG